MRPIRAPASAFGSGALGARRADFAPAEFATSDASVLSCTSPVVLKFRTSPRRTVRPVAVHACLGLTEMPEPDAGLRFADPDVATALFGRANAIREISLPENSRSPELVRKANFFGDVPAIS